MKTVRLVDDQVALVRWALKLHIDQSEQFAAMSFQWSLLARDPEHDRHDMRRELTEMRKCHELRARLSRSPR